MDVLPTMDGVRRADMDEKGEEKDGHTKRKKGHSGEHVHLKADAKELKAKRKKKRKKKEEQRGASWMDVVLVWTPKSP